MQTTSKDIGAVLHAYLDADRESGAPARRDEIGAAGMKPEEEFAALLKIEEALEQATVSMLSGKKVDLKNALGGIPAPA
jgi:hypothetical protein